MLTHLHVGAHKTATTYIQSMLAANVSALHANGIGYLPLAEFRRLVTFKLMKLDTGFFHLKDKVDRFFSHGRSDRINGLLLSDENIIGVCPNFVETGKLYQQAPARLRQLRKLLGGNEIHMFFAIRAYDTFIPSAYGEALRNQRKFVPFEDFWDRVDLEQCRWPVIFNRMREALQPERV